VVRWLLGCAMVAVGARGEAELGERLGVAVDRLYERWELGLQTEMGLDDLVSGAPAASLVITTDNSPRASPEPLKFCPDAIWNNGICQQHGQLRWVLMPCHRRTCEVCGPLGRYRIAQRICWGIRQSPCRDCGHKADECFAHGAYHRNILCPCKGYRLSAAFMVLTSGDSQWENPAWKRNAVKKLGKFITWLRKVKGMPDLQYVATYELTDRGRLHINLITTSWKEVPQAVLQDRWGARVSVSWVRDDKAIARETAKSYSPESLSSYMGKLKQSVPEEWGRRVSYSKKWPKLPKTCRRLGEILWVREWEIKPSVLAAFEYEKLGGWYTEVAVGEWVSILRPPPKCDCFDLVVPEEGARDEPG